MPARRAADEAAVAEVQAAVEGVAQVRQVDFLGEKYKMADKVGTMPVMKFARAMRSAGARAEDLTSADSIEASLDAMAAMYEMVRDCIHPDDWERFERDAITKRAEQEDLNKVLQQVTETIAARPTPLPSGSRNGRRKT